LAPEQKEIMIAVLGGSASIAGLLLVFCGFLFAQASMLPATITPTATIRKFKRFGRLGVAPFTLAILVTGTSFWWLLCQCNLVYLVTLWAFGLLLLATAIYGAVTILGFL
jgi:hypothetical protein